MRVANIVYLVNVYAMPCYAHLKPYRWFVNLMEKLVPYMPQQCKGHRLLRIEWVIILKGLIK